MFIKVRGIVLLALAVTVAGCQRPTSASSTADVNDAIDVAAVPDPITADTQTGGRTYRVVRGNNQPDDLLPYDWHAVFSITSSFNSTATKSSVDLSFPIRLTSAALVIRQAAGGVVTPPTGTETEKYESVTLSASGNSFSGVSSPVSMTFEVWYDLPSLRKEAVITVTLAFVDDDGQSFQKQVDLKVAP